jgi:hypothetical protein
MAASFAARDMFSNPPVFHHKNANNVKSRFFLEKRLGALDDFRNWLIREAA